MDNLLKANNNHTCRKIETEYGFFHIYENLNLSTDVRKVKIFLPKNYEVVGSFPVVYMNDGQTTFDPGGLSSWSWETDKTLHYLTEKNSISPVIVVAVYPKDRNYEYLKSTKYSDYEKNTIDVGGGLSDYSNYLANTLKPFIDATYKTDLSSEKTAIIGSSFGAIAALYLACTYPNKFGQAGVLSPSLGVGLGLQKESDQIEKTEFIKELETSILFHKKRPRLWIDWGRFEPPTPELGLKLIKILENKCGYNLNDDLFYFDDPIGTHDERAWAYRFSLIMMNFYGR